MKRHWKRTASTFMRGITAICLAAVMAALAPPVEAMAAVSYNHPYRMRGDFFYLASDWAVEGLRKAYYCGFVQPDLFTIRSVCTHIADEIKDGGSRFTHSNSFKDPITRGNFARLAVCWLEYALERSAADIIAERGLTVNYDAFADTSDPYILAAFTLGIVNGTKLPTAEAKGSFSPDGQLTREQAAVMLRNVCELVGMDTVNISAAGFADIGAASDWAADAVNFVGNEGIMKGTSTAALVFSPKTEYTLEQSIIAFAAIDPGYTPEEYHPIPYGGLEYRLSEAQVLERILAQKDIYIHGSADSNYPEFSSCRVGNAFYEDCAAFAEIIRFRAFGWLPRYDSGAAYYNDDYTSYNIDYDKIRIGDVIKMRTGGLYGHSAVIIGIDGTKITIAEANYDQKVNWGRVIDLEKLREKNTWFEVGSSYPQ